MDAYPYISDDPLETRPRYDYSDACGANVLSAWHDARQAILTRLRQPRTLEAEPAADDRPVSPPPPCWQSTDVLIHSLHDHLSKGLAFDLLNQASLDLLVKRFEAGKRLYAFLDTDGRSIKNSDYRNIERYVWFGEVLSMAWQRSCHFPYLNALLKIVDLVSSYAPTLPSHLRPRVIDLIESETGFVQLLAITRLSY